MSNQSAAEAAPVVPATGDAALVNPVLPGTPIPGRWRVGFTPLFIASYFATMMAVITPVTIAISLKLLQIAPDNTANAQALVLGVGALFAAIANPVAGFLSDRSRSRFGRRRSFIGVGVVIGGLGLGVMAISSTVPVLIVGWALAQLGYNIVFAVLYGLMADSISPSRRGRISGFIGLGQAFGVAGGVAVAAFFPTQVAVTFLVPAALALVVLAVLAVTAPDRRLSRADVTPVGIGSFFASFWVSPRRYPDYAWAWAGRFLMIFAQTAATSFTVLFLIARFGFEVQQIGSIALIVTLTGLVVQAVASPIGGWLSDRFHRRKVFVFASSLIFTVGVVIITLAPSFPVFLVGSAVISLGTAAYIAVDLALVTDVLPDNGARAGKDLGVFNLANTIPQSLAPAIAPVFLAIGLGLPAGQTANYPALFVAAAVISILGAISVFFVKGVR